MFANEIKPAAVNCLVKSRMLNVLIPQIYRSLLLLQPICKDNFIKNIFLFLG